MRKRRNPRSRRVRRLVWVLAAALGASGAAGLLDGAAAEFRPRIVREGTLSLGLNGQGGALLAGGLSDDFDLGAGLGLRVRYRTTRESAIGLSFEAQRYDAKVDPVLDEDAEWFQAITTTAEYVQYFRVRRRAPRYVLLGVGLLQTRRRLRSEETDFPGDGGVITLGAGTEIWWFRTLTIDLSLRYNGLFFSPPDEDLSLSHSLQLGVGLQFYTSR